MKDMTQKEALAEAIRRWGENATIEYRHSLKGKRGKLARYPCIVHSGQVRSFTAVEGQGNTWREAFDDARSR